MMTEWFGCFLVGLALDFFLFGLEGVRPTKTPLRIATAMFRAICFAGLSFSLTPGDPIVPTAVLSGRRLWTTLGWTTAILYSAPAVGGMFRTFLDCAEASGRLSPETLRFIAMWAILSSVGTTIFLAQATTGYAIIVLLWSAATTLHLVSGSVDLVDAAGLVLGVLWIIAVRIMLRSMFDIEKPQL